MNRKQLAYFLSAYRHSSIIAAAEEMFISPQGLSKMIAQLEAELSIRLFTRTGNRIYPTPEADRLVYHARSILDEFNLIEEKLFTANRPRHRVRILVTYDAARYIPAAFFRDFSARTPDILLCFEEMPDRSIITGLDSGEAELALLSEPIDAEHHDAHYLFSDRFSIVMSRKHPLAVKEQLTFSDLKDQPVVIKGSRQSFSKLQTNSFLREHIETVPVIETSDSSMIGHIAEDGYAIGMLPDYVAKDLSSDSLAVIPLIGDQSVKSIYLVRNKSAVLSPEAAIVSDALKAWYK